MQVCCIDCFTCANSNANPEGYRCIVSGKTIDVTTHKPCIKWKQPSPIITQKRRFDTTIVVAKSCLNCKYYGTACSHTDVTSEPVCDYSNWKLDDGVLQELV